MIWRFLRWLFGWRERPRAETDCFTGVDRTGVGWIKCHAARPDVRVPGRTARRLAMMDRVEFDLDGGNWARRLRVYRRQEAG